MYGTTDDTKLRDRRSAPLCRGYLLIDRVGFEHTARLLAQEFKELECPLDPGLMTEGVGGRVVMMTFDKDKCPITGLKGCTTGVALCDVFISITQSKTKVDIDGHKVMPWKLGVKCFGLDVQTDIVGHQLNMCDLGHHGVASLLDTRLDVGMSVASLIDYYKLQLKDVTEVTDAMIELYYDWLYATGDDKPTVAEAKKLAY